MHDGWYEQPFAEVIDFREGPGIMARDFRDTGVPLVRLAGVKSRHVLDSCNYLDPATVAQRWSQFRVEPGDVLLSTSASLGEVAVVDHGAAGAIPYTGIIRMRPTGDQVEPEFIPWLLRSPHFANQVRMAGVGSVLNHFGPSHLKRMSLIMPPLKEQRRIAGVLAALDDLVDTNRRLSRDSSMLAVTCACAAPDQVPLRELARVVDVQQFQPEGPIDHFSIPAFDERKLPERVDGASIKSAKLRLTGPTVLVSRLNPQTPRVWMAYPGDTPAGASTEFLTLQPSGEASVEEIWAACAPETFTRQMRSRVTGTTGSHQRVDKAAIPSLLVADIRLLDRATRTAISLLVRNAHESLIAASEAARTRDELLPLLLSGRVRVSADSSHSPGSCNGSLSASMS